MSDEEIKKYRLCVVVAGLLHDIGHCVLGHSYPRYAKNRGVTEITEHETMGIGHGCKLQKWHLFFNYILYSYISHNGHWSSLSYSHTPLNA